MYLLKSFINAKIRMPLNYIFLTFKNVTFHKIKFFLDNVDHIFPCLWHFIDVFFTKSLLLILFPPSKMLDIDMLLYS